MLGTMTAAMKMIPSDRDLMVLTTLLTLTGNGAAVADASSRA
jgi:hypothetical protein